MGSERCQGAGAWGARHGTYRCRARASEGVPGSTTIKSDSLRRSQGGDIGAVTQRDHIARSSAFLRSKVSSLSYSTDQTARAKQRLPLVTYILAAGVFLMGTSEFVVAGILPEISEDLGTSIAQTGMMITVFAIGMIVGTPTMAALTLKLSRRLALALLLVVFSIGHVVVAVVDSYVLILAARFLTALATGGFWAVAAVVAAQTAGAAMASRAVGIVLGGGMVANVLGVPLGSFAGQTIGWRGPFWALAVLSILGAFAVYRLIPADEATKAPPSLMAELKALRDSRVILVLLCCVVVTGSAMTVYSFIAPLITDVAGLPGSTIPLILVAYGLGGC